MVVGSIPTVGVFWAARGPFGEHCRLQIDESGVRTHASEEIAALTQRLRPFRHLATARPKEYRAPPGVAQMVERSLSMREVQGSIPGLHNIHIFVSVCGLVVEWLPATESARV